MNHGSRHTDAPDTAPDATPSADNAWVVRTVQQGPESVPDDYFMLLIRGDVDTP